MIARFGLPRPATAPAATSAGLALAAGSVVGTTATQVTAVDAAIEGLSPGDGQTPTGAITPVDIGTPTLRHERR
jgi:hypothetical protein